MPQRLSHCISSEAEASNSALFSPARLTMPPLNARSLATLALLLCATTLAGAAHGERQQPKQAGVLAAAGAPAAAGAGGPVLQRQLLDDDDDEHERDHNDDDQPRGWSRKGAAYTAPSSASGSVPDDNLGTAAGANATAAGAAVKPVAKRPTPAAASKGAMPFSDWVSDVMPHDALLMMSFVVAWFCAPGVVLLLWPFVYDGALSARDTVRDCIGPKVAST